MPKRIEGIEKAIAELGESSIVQPSRPGEFCFGRFGTLEKLTFFKDDADPAYDMELVLLSDRSAGESVERRISLKFGGVSGLSVKSFGGGLTQIVGLYVKDISRDGWEGLHWEIGQIEDSNIFFRCRNVSVATLRAA